MLFSFAVVRVPSAHAGTLSRRTNDLRVGQQSIRLFDGRFNHGASVAVADVNGDGQDDYIVGAGDTGGPQVIVYDQAGNKTAQFWAYSQKVRSGIFVAAGDLDGDGRAEIVVGPQPGYAPTVRIFAMDGTLRGSFSAFESSYTGGVYAAKLADMQVRRGRPIDQSSNGGQEEHEYKCDPDVTATHNKNRW